MTTKATMIFCSQIKKIFTIQESFNKQNDNMFAQSSVEAQEKLLCMQDDHHPSHVMVWLDVHWREGFTKVHFYEKGVKTIGKVYRKMLSRVYTFARVASRIARRTTSVPITYSLCGTPHHSPCHLWRSLSKQFFWHKWKDTQMFLQIKLFSTHAKMVHSHSNSNLQMFVQVAR